MRWWDLTSPPALSAYQFAFSAANPSSLLVLGIDTQFALTKIDGLDLPAVRSSDPVRPRDAGQFVGLNLLSGRTITLSGDVVPTDPTNSTSFETALRTFATAFEPTNDVETPFYFAGPSGTTYGLLARATKRSASIDKGWTAQRAVFSAQLHCTDPRVYIAPAGPVTISAPAPSGALAFPVTFPLTFQGAGSGNSAVVTNSGNCEMRPMVRVYGPCTDPALANASIAGTPKVTITSGVSGFTVNAGDWLELDFDLQTVTYNTPSGPGSPRPAWVTTDSTWWNLPPGANTIQFTTSDSSAVAGYADVWSASALYSVT